MGATERRGRRDDGLRREMKEWKESQREGVKQQRRRRTKEGRKGISSSDFFD